MKTKNQGHLDKKTILMAIIDEDGLPVSDRQHLSLCMQCREQKEKLEQGFVHLGKTAQKFTPAPKKRPVLPPEKLEEPLFAPRYWKPALATALTLMIVFAVSIWRIPSGEIENIASTGNSIDIWEEEQIMLEMDLLAENALPGQYMEVTSDVEVDFEEAFLDYIAPIEDNEPLSLDGMISGGDLC